MAFAYNNESRGGWEESQRSVRCKTRDQVEIRSVL